MAGWFGASLSSPSWLFAAAVLAACNSNPAADRPLRASSRPIMNGTLETDAEGVRVARVTIPSISNGSGALLTNEWILTAGHSTRRFGVKHVEPVASHLVKMGSSASRAAKRIVLHPDFVEHLNKNQDDVHDVVPTPTYWTGASVGTPAQWQHPPPLSYLALALDVTAMATLFWVSPAPQEFFTTGTSRFKTLRRLSPTSLGCSRTVLTSSPLREILGGHVSTCLARCCTARSRLVRMAATHSGRK